MKKYCNNCGKQIKDKVYLSRINAQGIEIKERDSYLHASKECIHEDYFGYMFTVGVSGND